MCSYCQHHNVIVMKTASTMLRVHQDITMFSYIQRNKQKQQINNVYVNDKTWFMIMYVYMQVLFLGYFMDFKTVVSPRKWYTIVSIYTLLFVLM